MANIGSERPAEDVLAEISQQLLDSFTNSGRKLGRSLVLELLTETEQILLAKRLAAVYMLIDGQSYYRIKQVLGMSTSTIKNLHRLLLAGNYSEMENYLLQKKEREKFAATVALLLRGGLPPRAYVVKKRRK